jgi:hypothetical protein
MKLAYNIYPSFIAKVLAGEVGLLTDVQGEYWGQISDELNEELDKIIRFQQMSLVASFEDCLIVYFGIDLSEKQLQNLNIIHDVTPKLLPGEMLCEQLAFISNETTNAFHKPDVKAINQAFHTVIDLITKKQRTVK